MFLLALYDMRRYWVKPIKKMAAVTFSTQQRWHQGCDQEQIWGLDLGDSALKLVVFYTLLDLYNSDGSIPWGDKNVGLNT